MTATSTHGVVGEQRRPSVRLDCRQTSLLRKLSAEVGCSRSDVLRRSLDHYAASRSPKPTNQRPEMKVATAGPPPATIVSRERPIVVPVASPESCPTTVVKDAIIAQSTRASVFVPAER